MNTHKYIDNSTGKRYRKTILECNISVENFIAGSAGCCSKRCYKYFVMGGSLTICTLTFFKRPPSIKRIVNIEKRL